MSAINPTTSSATEFDLNQIKSFVDNLLCPVELSPLGTAVSLLPCGHNVNEAAARALFQNASKDRSPVKCPLRCLPPVMSYIPNLPIRNTVASDIFKSFYSKTYSEEARPFLLPSLSAASLKPSEPPYQGFKKEEFRHRYGTWENFNSKARWGDTVEITFEAINPSLIQSFSLMRHNSGGSIDITIQYDGSDPELLRLFKQYLHLHQFIPKEETPFYEFIVIETNANSRRMLQFLAEHHAIPTVDAARGFIAFDRLLA